MITYQGTIYPWNCDSMKQMNIKLYAEKFDEATWTFFTYLGLTRKYLQSKKTGIVIIEQNLKFHKEVLAGDCVHVKSGVMSIEDNKKIRIYHQMYNIDTKKMVAETEILGIYISTTNRKTLDLPSLLDGKYFML